MMRLSLLSGFTLYLFAFAASLDATAQNDTRMTSSDAFNFETAAPNLHKASCPDETEAFSFSPLEITVTLIALGTPDDVRDALPSEVQFMGGWHLTSRDSHFGGLSGLEITETGDLLAVSDAGAFVEIGLTDNAPDGRARIGYMLGAEGQILSGKSQGDAEGLAYREGLALVSFERNHRVLAFDLENCQSAARGALVAKLPDQIDGQSIKANNGPEGLFLTSDNTLLAGYETVIDDHSPLLTIGSGGGVFGNPSYILTPKFFKLVGASQSAVLMRAYDPVRGNRNQINIPSQDITFQLSPPLTVDNFEGIAESISNDGSMMLYLISDDNFSARQRTLLYAFKIVQTEPRTE